MEERAFNIFFEREQKEISDFARVVSTIDTNGKFLNGQNKISIKYVMVLQSNDN